MEAGLEADLQPVQRLALAHAPRSTRAPILALLALDTRLSGFVRRGHEPLLAQMRLAWWRDTLGASRETWPRGDPLLDLLAGWRAPEALVALVDGWEALLGEQLDDPAIRDFAGGRQKAWQALAFETASGGSAGPAARYWALADLAANLSDAGERARVIECARGEPFAPPGGRALRPLAILGGLGRRALARGGRPLLDGRVSALAALRLGLLGR
jgi:phytoene synthase